MQEKALVMEVNENKMILLTRDGRFISQRVTGSCPLIGDEIDIPVPKAKKNIWFSGGFLAAAAVLLAVIFAGQLGKHSTVAPMTGTVVTYVTVDINPSVELGLDKNEIVVSVEPLNEDGKIVLQGKELVGKSSETAVEIIINSAADKGYLAPEKENKIIINVSQKDLDESKTKKLEKILPEKAETVLEERKLNAKVNVIKTDFDLRKQAKELGISAGKYAVLLEAKEAGLDVTAENIKKSGLVKAIKNAGGNPGEIILKAQKEKEFPQKMKAWKEELKVKNQKLQEYKETPQNKDVSVKENSSSGKESKEINNKKNNEKITNAKQGNSNEQPSKERKGKEDKFLNKDEDKKQETKIKDSDENGKMQEKQKEKVKRKII